MRESGVTKFVGSAEAPASQPRVPEKQAPLRRLVLTNPDEPPLPLQFVARARAPTRDLVKRSFDIVASLLLLIPLLPFFLLVAVAIKLDSPGPVFYRARRVGKGGTEFGMLKFRKMHDAAAGAPLTTHADPRLTRVGTLLTRTRIDELPQLWDVLRGRMSIVGPRPEDPGFVALRREAFSHVLKVRPGIAGLSQLAYAAEQLILKHEAPVDDYLGRILPQKLTLDALYAENHSLRMDLAILRWTFVTLVLRRPVAVNRQTGAMNIRKPRAALPSAGSPEAAASGNARPVPEDEDPGGSATLKPAGAAARGSAA